MLCMYYAADQSAEQELVGKDQDIGNVFPCKFLLYTDVTAVRTKSCQCKGSGGVPVLCHCICDHVCSGTASGTPCVEETKLVYKPLYRKALPGSAHGD